MCFFLGPCYDPKALEVSHSNEKLTMIELIELMLPNLPLVLMYLFRARVVLVTGPASQTWLRTDGSVAGLGRGTDTMFWNRAKGMGKQMVRVWVRQWVDWGGSEHSFAGWHSCLALALSLDRVPPSAPPTTRVGGVRVAPTEPERVRVRHNSPLQQQLFSYFVETVSRLPQWSTLCVREGGA